MSDKIEGKTALEWSNIGHEYAESGNFQKAIECFKKVVEIDPQDVEIWYELGVAYNKLKDKKHAKKCVETALELDPNYPEALNLLKELNEKEN